MSDWLSHKFEITRQVRSVLVHFRIDRVQLAFRVYPDRVLLQGRVTREQGTKEDVDALTVQSLVSAIDRIKGVKRVDLDLKNWQRTPAGKVEPKTTGEKRTAPKNAGPRYTTGA